MKEFEITTGTSEKVLAETKNDWCYRQKLHR